jgi:hypothetical protein
MKYIIPVLLMFCAIPARAAIQNCTNTNVVGTSNPTIVCVQATPEADTTTSSVTSFMMVFGSPVTAGNTLICSFSIGSNIQTGLTVKDNVNGSVAWTQAYATLDATNARALYQFYWNNTAGGTPTVTVAWTSSIAEDGGACFEYKNLATSSVLDKVASQCLTGTVTAGNSTSGSTASTTQANELLVGGIRISSSGTTTISSQNLSFVSIATDTFATTNHMHTNTSNESVSATSTYAYNPTLSASVTGMCAGIATYKAAPATAKNMPPVIY